jgi:PD-(D/E)XK nuclease superfamily
LETENLPLLRQSERAAFKRCNWAWYQQYVLNIRPKVEVGMEAADFGTLIHVALAEYYIPGTVRGPHPADTFTELAKDKIVTVKTTEYTNDESVAKWEDFHDLGVNLMEEYVSHYGGDPHWLILDAERRFNVVIPDVRFKPMVSEKGRRGFRPICLLVGTLDLCVRDLNDDKVKMVDHKTAQAIVTNHLTLDEQASTYIAVGTTALRHQGLIGEKDSIDGMEFNFIRKASIDNREQNEKGEYLNLNGTVSKRQPKPIFERHYVPRTYKERQRQIVRISEEARVMDDVRSGRMPLLKTPQRDCYYCKFFDLCELDEGGGDTEYFIETTMERGFDPYSDHREGAGNSKKVTDGIAAEG